MKTKLLAAALSAWAMASCGGQESPNGPGACARDSVMAFARKANIYEANIRQYTPEGTFKAFQKHLPRLSEQGVSILWLMPVTPISEDGRKGSLGSYYAVKNYTEANPEFGTVSDLKELVDEAHKLGMKVIIDWVANHTGRDNAWVSDHKDWYTQDSLGNIICPEGTDWTDVCDLNYDSHEMRQAMADAMKFWVKATGIDGFRCDMAGMVPIDFWSEARKQISEIKPVFMLAEDSQPEIHQVFDASYNWEIFHCLNDIAQGKKNADSLIAIWEEKSGKFKPGDLWLNFTSNHDENSWSGSEYDRMGSLAATMAALTYCLPGMPLTYSGQEAASKKALRFFDKDTLDFSQLPLKDFYAFWNHARKTEPALQDSGPVDFIRQSPGVLMFERGSGSSRLLFAFNFGADTAICLSGKYVDRVSGQHVEGQAPIAASQYMMLAPRGAGEGSTANIGNQ